MSRHAVKRPFEYGAGERPELQRARWPHHQAFTARDSAVERGAVRTAAAFVAAVRWELREREMSQAEAARRAGLSEQTVSAVLRGDVWPDLRTAASLAHVLAVPLIEAQVPAGDPEPEPGQAEPAPQAIARAGRRTVPRPAPGRFRCRACDEELQRRTRRASMIRTPIRTIEDEGMLGRIVEAHHGSLLEVSVGDCLVADRLMELIAHRVTRENT